MKRYISVLAIFFLLLFSCGSDRELDRTIFIPDENDYRLPAYTEWGYNSFGAEFERDYFLASHLIVPCKIMYDVDNGKLTFSLHGVFRYDRDLSILFIFPFESISDFSELLNLNDVEIDLTDSDCIVQMIHDNGEPITINVLNGTLHFKRAQLLRIDERVNRVILSGVFDLRFIQNLFPVNISNGRFDMGVTQNVFHIQ